MALDVLLSVDIGSPRIWSINVLRSSRWLQLLLITEVRFSESRRGLRTDNWCRIVEARPKD